MKSKFIISALASILWASYINAQSGGGISRDLGTRVPSTQFATSGAEAASSELWLKGLGKPINPYDESRVKGSPYYSEGFMPGQVFFNGELMGTFYLRHNAYQDEIQLKKELNDPEFQALAKAVNVGCTLGGKELLYTFFINKKGEQQSGYLIKLSEGKNYTLYTRKIKKFMEGKTSGNSLARNVPPRFIDEEEWYLGTATSNKKSEIEKSKNKFINLFDENHRAAISEFIKKEKLRTDNERDLLLTITFANNL